VNIRDVNQEYLLGIPELMKSLVNLACQKDCKYDSWLPEKRALPVHP